MANLVTSPQILPLVQPVLQDSIIENIKDTDNFLEFKIDGDNRTLDREKVETILTKNSITFTELTRNVGSFGGTEISTYDGKKVRLIYKLKGNRGSGGGAEATRLTESAQCLYAAIAFGLGRKITSRDITVSNTRSYSNIFKTDETVERILSELPDVWIQSSILGANKIYDTFKRGKYTFHRGSSEVNRINAIFSAVKKNENVRIDINKWNPADIWMISDDFDFEDLIKERTILGLNQVIQEKLEDKLLIGVSLKKMIGRATLSVKNVFRDMASCKFYEGYEYSKTSMDGYIILTGGTKIQYRSFGGSRSLTGFQGEVKGSLANQGKVSLGPTNMILRNHGASQVPTNAARRVRSEPLRVWGEISLGLKKYANMNDKEIEDLRVNPKVTESWMYSKLQVTQLLDILLGLKSKIRDQIVEDLYLYASSQSKYSSAYYKLE